MVSNQEICDRMVAVATKCFAYVAPVAPGDAIPKPSIWEGIRWGIPSGYRAEASIDKIENDHLVVIAYAMCNLMRERRMVSLCEGAQIGALRAGECIVAEVRANGVVAFITEDADGKSFLNVQPSFLMIGPERYPGQTEERYEEVMRSIGADYRPPEPSKEVR